MKKPVSAFFLILMMMAISLACSLPGLTSPPPTDEPLTTQEILAAETTATEESAQVVEPTAPEVEIPSPDPPEPTAQPSITSPNAGQIAYIYNGNVWRYFVDSKEIVQVTSDGILADHLNSYSRPGFSVDGRYLAYNQGTRSAVQDLVNDTVTDISPYGQFFAWSETEVEFFGVRGDFACPDIDDLDDQSLISFDILRFDLNDLANPSLVATIGGGLNFPAAISGDGQWASIVYCACYSECGGENLWYLPTLSAITPPINLFPGSIDFSPDNTQLTVSEHQMFGYVQSPLYVASVNFSGMNEIFSIPNVAPINAKWSPDGEWIAFTSVIFADDAFTETDRCVRLIKPDGSQEFVAECLFADFITWSPDGTQLLYSQKLGTQQGLFIYDLATSGKSTLPIQADPYTEIAWGRLP